MWTQRVLLVSLLAALALLLLGRGALAAEQAVRDPALPTATGFVNDYAGVLPAAERERLEALLTSLERETGAEMAVAVVPSTAPETPKMYAVKLFQAWGVGKKGKDNGVLFLVALEERRVEVEVGYGLEGILPDGLVGQILDEKVIPRFREGGLARGIADGVAELAARVRVAQSGGGAGAPTREEPGSQPSNLLFAGALALAAVVLAAEVIALRRRAPRCPRCGGRLATESETLREATSAMPGEGMQQIWCTRCDYRTEQVFSIPWVQPGGPGGVGWGGRHGGFRRGGGGFGGFGGGRSGGGGAGRRW